MVMPAPFHVIAFALLCVVTIIAATTDVRTGLVPNWLTLPAAGLGVLLAILAGLIHPDAGGRFGPLSGSLLGLLAGFLPCLVFFIFGLIGGGDVKLMAAVGAISASPAMVLDIALYATLVAMAYAIVMIIRRKLLRQTIRNVTHAAMMAAAKQKPNLSDDGPRAPIAVAIAIGAGLAGAEHLLGWQPPWAPWGF